MFDTGSDAQNTRIPRKLTSHRARRVLRVRKTSDRLRLDRSKAPHRVRGHDALHRDQWEGLLGKKISLPSGILRRRAAVGGIPQGELILSLGPPSHKPLKRSFSVSSAPLVTPALSRGNEREIS